MSKLFVCGTYYHTLITLIKELEAGEVCDLVLWNDIPEFETLENNLKKTGVFHNIYIFDAVSYWKKVRPLSDIMFTLRGRHITKKFMEDNLKINYSEYDDIYVYHDTHGPGQYFIMEGIRYHLIEDALDYFAYFDEYANIPLSTFQKQSLKTKIKKLLKIGFVCWGQSDACIDIEVNDIKKIKISERKVIEAPRQELFDKLTAQQKKIVYNTYTNGNELVNFAHTIKNKKVIILTQPLFKDEFVKDIKDQYRVYYCLTKGYADQGYQVTIKPHPRDDMDYSSIIKEFDCVYVDKNIPSEILNYDMNSCYELAISITSTAINFINTARIKRIYGREYIDVCLKK